MSVTFRANPAQIQRATAQAVPLKPSQFKKAESQILAEDTFGAEKKAKKIDIKKIGTNLLNICAVIGMIGFIVSDK